MFIMTRLKIACSLFIIIIKFSNKKMGKRQSKATYEPDEFRSGLDYHNNYVVKETN